MTDRTLLDHHLDLLRSSAIAEEVVVERGYWTAQRKTELQALGFAPAQRVVPTLVIPIRDDRGELVTYQVRPDQPRIDDKSGKPLKYESPGRSRPALDVPPRCREALRSPNQPLWITEGARKADAAASAGLCCVSLPGVWSWAKRLNGDARTVLPELFRIRLEDRKVVVAFDSDVMIKPAVRGALEALVAYLVSQEALVSCLYLPELEPGVKTGLDDFLAAGHGVEDLWGRVEAGMRAAPEPKSERRPPLHTAHLLRFAENLLRRYVSLPGEHELTAIALFALHTWALEAADCTPYLLVTSPEKRSGKSRLLEVLELCVNEPINAASITAAAVFQAIEAMRPTLLIDEIDAIFTGRPSERTEELRGVLNAGNRSSASVVRGTQEGTPARFRVFCPKVLSGIDNGRLPDTITDRSIVIRLERKRRQDRLERLRPREIAEDVAELRERLGDWAAAHMGDLAAFRCDHVPEISDRLEDGWEPLLAIAHLAGTPWPARARAAAIALAGANDELEAQDHGSVLLAALRSLFEADGAALSSKAICEGLNDDDELPFGAYRGGQGVDARGLSRLLRPYGIKPRKVRADAGVLQGYHRDQFAEAWERYCQDQGRDKNAREQDPALDPEQAEQAEHRPSHGSLDVPDVPDVPDTAQPDARARIGESGSQGTSIPQGDPPNRHADGQIPGQINLYDALADVEAASNGSATAAGIEQRGVSPVTGAPMWFDVETGARVTGPGQRTLELEETPRERPEGRQLHGRLEAPVDELRAGGWRPTRLARDSSIAQGDPPDRNVLARDAAVFLGVHPNTLAAMVRRGELALAIDAGRGKRWYRLADLRKIRPDGELPPPPDRLTEREREHAARWPWLHGAPAAAAERPTPEELERRAERDQQELQRRADAAHAAVQRAPCECPVPRASKNPERCEHCLGPLNGRRPDGLGVPAEVKAKAKGVRRATDVVREFTERSLVPGETDAARRARAGGGAFSGWTPHPAHAAAVREAAQRSAEVAQERRSEFGESAEGERGLEDLGGET